MKTKRSEGEYRKVEGKKVYKKSHSIYIIHTHPLTSPNPRNSSQKRIQSSA
jgi:hypothetical protein